MKPIRSNVKIRRKVVNLKKLVEDQEALIAQAVEDVLTLRNALQWCREELHRRGVHDENGCLTLPNGECLGIGCVHDGGKQ